MFRLTRRRILRSYLVLVIVWALLIVVMYVAVGGISSLWFLFGPSLKLSRDQLKQLMDSSALAECSESLIVNPLLRIVSPGYSFIQFFDLPKRKTHLQYNEVTSANRDSRFPLAPDFTFHIDYSKHHVVLYEGYGPACVYRIFIYPSLPTSSQVLHGMTSSNLSAVFLVMDVDGEFQRKFSLRKLAEANEWPFVYPLSAKHPSPVSGIGAYTPFCYQKSLRISYENDRDFPPNLLDLNVNCTANELLCPVHIYSAVSSHKFPAGTSAPSDILDETLYDLHSDRLKKVADLLKNPESNGPSAGERCILKCFELCSQCQHVMFHRSRSAEVITSLRIRVFMSATGLLSPDWTNLLLTAYFDDASTPRFSRIPLGSLFGATASLNDFSGAAFGKRSIYCDYEDGEITLERTVVTGYFYFPMPYWQEALIRVEGAENLRDSVTVCFQVTTVENFYVPSKTGYLHAIKIYYSGSDVGGWREVLDVNGGWGHIVSLSMEIDNLVPVLGVPLAYRWATLQADPVIHIDGSRSATILGTGLEDYFSYAHGFAGAENTTYAFVGVYHAGKPPPGRSDPLTWHCYRQHVLDPITFRTGVRFFMEGTGSEFSTLAKPLDYQEHHRLKSSSLPTLAHLVLYYFRSNSERLPIPCDFIQLGNSTSEQQHRLQLTSRRLGSSGGKVTLSNRRRRFLGDTSRNRTFVVSAGRSFGPADVFSFELTVSTLSAGLFRLRRTSYAIPRQWNDRTEWSVNGVHQPVWFVPMGSLSEEYSLVDSDQILCSHQLVSPGMSSEFTQVRFEFRPTSASWYNIRYELCPLLD